ncbi:MAG TPA: glycosyltransferase family 4 protein [Vicinamibacterales bacterium]|nr:glycosyltransferase family 4 protein [Vicinamibacterales bacterium]
MKVLFVATRVPWPAKDGGRVLMSATIQGLAARGHEIHVVAPHPDAGDPAPAPDRRVTLTAVAVKRSGRVGPALRSLVGGEPVTVAAHRHGQVADAVRRRIARERFDLVHVEQVQAMSQVAPGTEHALPVVLRAQNVESDLWSRLADARTGWNLIARREARRLGRWEAAAVARASVTVALTAEDGERLQAMGGSRARIEIVRAPMPARLPQAPGRLAGTPAVTCFSGTWLPNRDGVEWFVRDVWPEVTASFPEGRLHLFGSNDLPAAPQVMLHPPPDDSVDLFAPGSILVVPLRIGSGVRIRILEAWARRVPVVATPTAAAGLSVRDGEGLRIASTPEQFAVAIRDLATDARATQALIDAGEARLKRAHDPGALAKELEDVYESVRT